MNKFRNYLLATLGLGILVGSLVFSSSYASIASQGALDVKVVNTATQPVPTQAQGTTNIAGTVQAQQSGAWNVGISGTPDVNLASGASVGINPSGNTVQVGNTASAPVLVRDVDSPARQPFQDFNSIDLVAPFGNTERVLFTVPTDKRLVIEFISLLALMPADQKSTVTLRTFINDGHPSTSFGKSFLVLTAQGTFNATDIYTASQPVRIYADPGTEVFFLVSRTSGTGSAQYQVCISGYFVDVP
jgi:hypothetical protein